MLLHREELKDYADDLTKLKAEDDELEIQEKAITKRRGAIKATVKVIAEKLVEKEDRAILPAGVNGAWDRRVSRTGAGLSIALLEEELGTVIFRKLCCIKETVYTPSPELIEAARLKGKITDKVLEDANVSGDITHSLYKMTPDQYEKQAGIFAEV